VIRYGVLLSGQPVAIFEEKGMKYICVLDNEDRIVRAADSIRKLGRIDEFQSVLDEYRKKIQF